MSISSSNGKRKWKRYVICVDVMQVCALPDANSQIGVIHR